MLFLVSFGVILGALLAGIAYPLLRSLGSKTLPEGAIFSGIEDLRAKIAERDQRDLKDDGSVSLRSLLVRHPSDFIMYELAPDLDLIFQRVRVQTNSFGMRDAETSLQKKPGIYRIALLGDSFAFGWGVEAHQTFAAELNRSDYAVYNLGIPADTWKEYHMRLKWAERTLPRPDLILVATYDNDFVDDETAEQLGAPAVDRLLSIRGWLLHSQVVRLAARACDALGLSNFLVRLAGGEVLTEATYERDLPAHERVFYQSERWHDVRLQIETFLKRAKTIAPSCLVVRVTPAYCNGLSWQAEAIRVVNKPSNIYDFGRMNDELKRICARYSARYTQFAPATEAETRAYYYPYDMHLTARGHHALAVHLLRSLRENTTPDVGSRQPLSATARSDS